MSTVVLLILIALRLKCGIFLSALQINVHDSFYKALLFFLPYTSFHIFLQLLLPPPSSFLFFLGTASKFSSPAAAATTTA